MEIFLHPERFWHLAWLVPALTILFLSAEIRRKNAVKKILGNAHFSKENRVPAGVNLSPTKRVLRFFLLVLSTIFFVATYAKPAWEKEIVPFTAAGRDVVVALDLSKSMLGEDVAPSRLAHSKRFVSELVSRMKGDRFALVVFAGDAFLSCPLTFDSVSFQLVLESEKIGNVPVGGTNIERALSVAAAALPSAENLGNAAIVLISDGGELTGTMERVSEKLRAAKIPVVVVGVGDPNSVSPIPLRSEKSGVEYLKDSRGNAVSTRLEENSLREVAAKTGGIYIRSTLLEMNDSVAADWLRRLTPSALEENLHEIPIERWPLFLIPAIAFFFAFLLLGECLGNAKKNRESLFEILLKSAPILAIFAGTIFGAGTTFGSENSAGTTAEEIFNEALEAQKNHEIERSRALYENSLLQKKSLAGTRTATTQNLGALLHEEARNELSEAEKNLHGNAAEAEKIADSAEKKFKNAEEFYREVLKSGDAEFAAGTAKNQQILLNDLKRLEDLKKEISEQKKQQEEQNSENSQQDENSQNGENSQQQSGENDDSQNSQNAENENSQNENSENSTDENSEQSSKQNRGNEGENSDESRGNDEEESQQNSAGTQQESDFDDATAEKILREMRNSEESRREEILKNLRGKERSAEKDW